MKRNLLGLVLVFLAAQTASADTFTATVEDQILQYNIGTMGFMTHYSGPLFFEGGQIGTATVVLVNLNVDDPATEVVEWYQFTSIELNVNEVSLVVIKLRDPADYVAVVIDKATGAQLLEGDLSFAYNSEGIEFTFTWTD